MLALWRVPGVCAPSPVHPCAGSRRQRRSPSGGGKPKPRPPAPPSTSPAWRSPRCSSRRRRRRRAAATWLKTPMTSKFEPDGQGAPSAAHRPLLETPTLSAAITGRCRCSNATSIDGEDSLPPAPAQIGRLGHRATIETRMKARLRLRSFSLLRTKLAAAGIDDRASRNKPLGTTASAEPVGSARAQRLPSAAVVHRYQPQAHPSARRMTPGVYPADRRE